MRGAYGETTTDVEEGFKLAREAAERALAMDPQLAAAHLAQADVLDSYDFKWNAARAALGRALALVPDDATALMHAGGSARVYGRNQEACDFLRRAVELDPVNAQIRIQYAFALNSVGRYEEAKAEFRRVIEISPTAVWGHAGVSLMFSAQGRFDEAAAEAALQTTAWSRLFALTIARWGQKKTAESDAALKQLIDAHGEVAAVQVAWAYGFRGDADHAFEWLERSYRQHDSGLGWTRSTPWLDSLHRDPRWEIFLRKVGLADEQLK